MNTSTHTFKHLEVKVTPTMEALGDQPFICEERRLSDGFRRTYTIEAGLRFTAASKAVTAFTSEHSRI